MLKKRDSRGKEKRAAGSGELSRDGQGCRRSLRSSKQHLPAKPLTQEPSPEDEECSSEDAPLLIRRRKKPVGKPQSQNRKPCSGSRSSRDGANRACGQRTGRASQRVLVRLSGTESSDESELPPEGTQSPVPSASHLPAEARRAQSRTSPPRSQLDSDTESESSQEEFQEKDSNVEVSRVKTSDGVSSSAKALAAQPRECQSAKGLKTLELFPRGADGWSEKELQKLHR